MSGAPRIEAEETMAELCRAIGEDAAMKLARHLGGTLIYIPQSADEHHPLRAILGDEGVAKLMQAYGGSRFCVPKRMERRTRVRMLHQAGALTVAAIAVETGYSERQVYRILSEVDDRQIGMSDNEPDDRQLNMF